MKKFFILPLFCLALVLVLPLQVQATELDDSVLDESVKCGCSKPPVRESDKCGCNANKPPVRESEDKCGCSKPPVRESDKCGCNATKPPSRDMVDSENDENWFELAQFIDRLSAIEEDESSPLGRLNNLIKRGDFVVLKDDFLEALEHAQLVIIDHNDYIADDQIEKISDMFNALIDVVEQESYLDMRDCSSQCDDAALKIKKILCVLNKAIFCDVAVFRNSAIFQQRVEMKDGLEIDGRLRVNGKVKVDKLEAKKAEIKKLEANKAEIDKLEVEEAVIATLEVCDLDVTCLATIEALEVLTSATVDCDLTVGCNIFMNNSTSPAVGNIYKAGVPFIHNFGANNTFVGDNAGNFTMTGGDNTAVGYQALLNNTIGNFNTASGLNALRDNTTGNNNTALGRQSMTSNSTGIENTATGVNTLLFNTTGDQNTATGVTALQANVSGNRNVAVGHAALNKIMTGSLNIAVGPSAGTNLTLADSNNIDIGNGGVAGDSGVIRIGTLGTQTTAFMAGINPNVSGSPVTVTVDTITGQLGIVPSSIRFKENVQDMNDKSSPILNLRPVTFTYKKDLTHREQIGLIAEEVNEILPALVVRDGHGLIETVKYHELAVLLLNELIKINARLTLLEEQVCY